MLHQLTQHSLPRGNRLIAFAIIPANPATTSGCRSIVSTLGSGVSNIPSPRTHCTTPPTRLELRRKLTGSDGKSAVVVGSAVTVADRPAIRSRVEAAMPARGPEIAKSNRELTSFGGDSRGVIAVVRPRVRDGTRVGRPALNCDVGGGGENEECCKNYTPNKNPHRGKKKADNPSDFNRASATPTLSLTATI